MNEKLQALLEQYNQKVLEFEKLNDGILEKESIDADDQKLIDEAEAELKTMKESIDEKKKLIERKKLYVQENFDQIKNKTVNVQPSNKKAAQYSISKAIREGAADATRLTGKEAEVHQETLRQAQMAGVKYTGGVAIPQSFKKESLTATDAGDTNLSDLVPTDIRSMMYDAFEDSDLRKLGATFETGLTGNVQYDKMSFGKAYWEGEIDPTDEITPTKDRKTMSPHRMAAKILVSQQAQIQTSVANDARLIGHLRNAVTLKHNESWAKKGGAADAAAPAGLLDQLNVAPTGFTGTPTYAELVAFRRSVQDNYKEFGRVNYALAMAKGLAGALEVAEKSENSAAYLYENGRIVGFPVVETAALTETDGSGTTAGTTNGAIFGDFAKFIVGQWGPIFITTDPYSRADEALVRYVINSYWSYLALDKTAFAVL